jgi:hypothetical protein
MVHLDRPLVNSLEATFAPAVPSHLLTQRFLTLTGNTALKHGHLAPWTAELAGGTVVDFTTAPIPAGTNTPNAVAAEHAALYRGLELLTVKPWTVGTPNYGKVAGKINVNISTDPRVFMALADPQPGNAFVMNDLYNGNPADPNTVFGRLMLARGGAAPAFPVTYNSDPASGSTVTVQVPTGTDTPLRSFGTSGFGMLDPAYFPQASPLTSQGLASTAGKAGIFSITSQQGHPYLEQELFRKIQNNLTTTTDTYAVYITIGFFEVTNTPNTLGGGGAVRPALGKELFKDMPGDFRQRYFAVVDRSNLSLDPTNIRQQGGKPLMTELTATVQPTDTIISVRAHGGTTTPPPPAGGFLTVNYEGQQFTISAAAAATNYLRLGTGLAAEWVQVTNAGSYDPTTGLGVIVVKRNSPPPVSPIAGAIGLTALALPAGVGVRHENGDAVMNVIPGNPGPPSTTAPFNPRATNYQAVVPYFVRID